jgi:hypothetical protein
LTVIEGKILKISAPLKSLREKEKRFPTEAQRHREKRGTTLSSLCGRLIFEQSVKI